MGWPDPRTRSGSVWFSISGIAPLFSLSLFFSSCRLLIVDLLPFALFSHVYKLTGLDWNRNWG